MRKKTSKNKKILFVIRPIVFTSLKIFDVLAFGELKHLMELKKKYKSAHLIKASSFGGVPILILDTCDNMRDAYQILREVEISEKRTTEKTLQKISKAV